MEEENNLLVSLGTKAVGEENLKLEKLVENCRNKTFGKILDYMLKPEEDELNPAYNDEERALRNRIQGWKDLSDRRAGRIGLQYKKSDGNYFSVDFGSYVKDYDDIVRQGARNSDFGEKAEYTGIELYAKFEPVGGR